MDNQLKNFVEKFFINLGAQVILQGDYILVSNVPESFEKFYGKNSPYKFVFSSQKMSSDSSLVEKGSYTLKAISNYLENSGETTLLKINFECDGENEIRKRIKISNAKIKKFLPKKKYSIFFRFTFHTTYQYLNKKKKIINEIYVHEGKIINGNLKDYPVSEGKRNEIRIPDIKESYFIAKEELKNKLVEETEKFKEKLSGKLNREIERIEKHFSNEEEEIEINLRKAEEKLEELLIEADSSKISRQKSLIKNLKEKLNIEEKTREKNQAILIEKNRYGLNVNNKLFNTTLIYHPIFSYDVELKNNSSNKKIEISFNPLTQEISLPKCESCQEEIDEIYLCENGHVSCKNCFVICESCMKGYCKKCHMHKCEICGKKICDSCRVRCSSCGKLICKDHTKKDPISGKVYCKNCLLRCERCGELKIGTNFKKSQKTGVKICEECYRKEMQSKTIKNIFD